MGEADIDEGKELIKIQELVKDFGGDPETFEGKLITQLVDNSLKLLREGHDTGQLKLITRALKEMRYSYRVFNKYTGSRRVSIFGSARTPESHPDYLAAKEFSEGMAKHGWMCITGGANGIMKAGLEGQTPETSFGLSIRLPFEVPTNTIIEGDPKHISFNYFFTRKLMFMSHADALVAFPGGFGTLDELFEMLTLIQTGKGKIIPIVMMEGVGGVYWHHWENYVEKNLGDNGWICPEDMNLFRIAETVQEGLEHIQNFYKRYDSSRYVKDMFVIRMKSALKPSEVAELNKKYHKLVVTGEMEQTEALPEEHGEFPDFPRLVFHHNRKDFGLVRALIDDINLF